MSLRESNSGRLNEDLGTLSEMTVLKHMQREAAMAAAYHQQPPRSKFMITDILGNGKHQQNSEHHSTTSNDHRRTPSPHQPRDLSMFLNSTPDNDDESDCDSSKFKQHNILYFLIVINFMIMILNNIISIFPPVGEVYFSCPVHYILYVLSFFTIRILMRAI